MGCGSSKKEEASAAAPSAQQKADAPKRDGAAGSKSPAGGGEGDKNVSVMGKYTMNLGGKDVMGEGASSVCRKGKVTATSDPVAIKVLKSSAAKQVEVALRRFKRQVEVLNQLQTPFAQTKDNNLWHPFFEAADPKTLFMIMLDYSKAADGGAGPEPSDGLYYMITELGQYSLKDFLSWNRKDKRSLSVALVKGMTRSILRVVAGLHCKNLVHLDLKPENIMSFSGCLKLIDVDGCVEIDTEVRIEDKTVSFSPCYCSPQWAMFLIDEKFSKIAIKPTHDVWSIGLTLAELVTPRPVMQPMYTNMIKKASGHGEAGFLFMDWLRGITEVPEVDGMQAFDKDFRNLLITWLLVADVEQRKTCAQALDHPFIADAKKEAPDKANSSDIKHEFKKRGDAVQEDMQVNRANTDAHKGRIWQLKQDGSVANREDWMERDALIGAKGTVSWFNAKDRTSNVLLSLSNLYGARVSTATKDGARGPVFQVDYEDAEGQTVRCLLAADTKPEAVEWVRRLTIASKTDMPTMRLGEDVAELRSYVISVKNRRISLNANDANHDGYQPVFKEQLWKLRADGNMKKEDDWRERETWISKNGSLIYFSKKEGKDLVYYAAEDLQKAVISAVPASDSCKPYTFRVKLPEVDGVSFAPGDFAANSEDLRTKWMAAFRGAAADPRSV